MIKAIKARGAQVSSFGRFKSSKGVSRTLFPPEGVHEPVVIVWSEVALGIVTLLFITSRTVMGYLIAINGVLCHGAFALNLKIKRELRLLDVVCNAVMAAYANTYVVAQPHTGVLTTVALISWRVNNRIHSVGSTRAAITHAVLVQLPVLVAILHFAAVTF